MRRLFGMLSLCALAACGANATAAPPHRQPAVSAGTSADPGLAVATAVTVDRYVAALRQADLEVAVHDFLASIPPPPPPVVVPQVTASSTPAPTSGSGGCASGGGSLDAVPAYVVARESGGNYCAANPSGACGAYQIMPQTWAGFGGYASACDAPPAVQDEKARTMAACNWQPPNYCAG